MKIQIKSFPIEKIFLVISIFFGILFIIFIPPFQGNDEVHHFLRAYQISQLRLVSQKQNNKIGDYLPASMKNLINLSRYDEIRWDRDKKFTMRDMHIISKIYANKDNVIFIDFINTSLYPPFAYLGLSFGIKLTDSLGLPLIYSFYSARIINFLLWIMMIYFAIKIAPIYKRLFLLLALMPTTLYQVTTISADTVIIGAGLLLTALFLYYKQDNKRIDKLFIGIFVFGILSIFLIKFIYVPLALLFFLIPEKNFISKKQRYFLFISIVILGLFFTSLWSFLNKDQILPQYPGIDVTKQIHFIITHPFYYLWVIISTLTWNIFTIIGQFISILGWNLVPAKPSPVFFVIYFIFLIFSSIADTNKDYFVKRKEKYIIAVSFLLSLILICTIQYLTWNPVGRYHILGIYGRYFTPVVVSLFLLIYNNTWVDRVKGAVNFIFQKRIIEIFCLLSLSYNLLLIIFRYWEL